jgi:hypothetical protein
MALMLRVVLRSSYEHRRSSFVSPRRGEQPRLAGFARFCNLDQGICAQNVDEDIKEGGEDGPALDIGEQGEEREEERRLVIYAAVVGRDIVVVEKEAFLHC